MGGDQAFHLFLDLLHNNLAINWLPGIETKTTHKLKKADIL